VGCPETDGQIKIYVLGLYAVLIDLVIAIIVFPEHNPCLFATMVSKEMDWEFGKQEKIPNYGDKE